MMTSYLGLSWVLLSSCCCCKIILHSDANYLLQMIISIIAIYQPQKTPDHDNGFGLNDHDHHVGPNYQDHCFGPNDHQLISRPVTLVASPDASQLA